MMITRKKAGLRYYQFETLLFDELTQAVFSRQGGVSPTPWKSLNLGGTVGDDPDRVLKNKNKLLGSIGYSSKQISQVHQVHSAKVVVVTEPNDNRSVFPQADAMITNTPGILLLMRFADCVPVLFYDPVIKAAGIAHAGWKGTIKEVAFATVNKMEKQFGTDPSDLIVGIGPSIGPDHYRVGIDVINGVKNTYGDNWDQVLTADPDDVKFNLWKANEISLRKAGVLNIETAGICTGCSVDEWYSHRGENGKTGRFAAVIGLK